MAAAALARSDTALSVVWEAQERQAAFISCPVFEIFFGGARGGGKTDAVLGDFLEHADAYGEHAIGLMIRRTRVELVETIERSKVIYQPLGWTFHEQDKMWRAPNGARLRFAYLERDQDAQAYQGHSYTRIYVEEIGNFPSDKPILKLMACLRSGAGAPVGFRATGNPGGPGHHWVKARYIDHAPGGWVVVKDAESGLERVFIPSKVQDNKYLGEEYINQLKASGSKELVRAWLEGDWSVIEGAFFDCWNTAQHVVSPFAIPLEWLRFRSADWGFARPFSVGWWAVVGDDHALPDGRVLPRGALVRYREWYGSSGQPNVGLRLTAEEVAAGIKERDGQDKLTYSVLDPAAFAQDGGPSIAERMGMQKVHFSRADNKRVTERGAMGGWDQMRSRMVGDADGRPMLYVFSTCRDFIRTVPSLQHDPDKPEDLDTESEDHCFTGDTLVRTDKGLYNIVDLVGTEGKTPSHDGEWHRFRSVRLVKRDQRVVRLNFSDGSSVRCTPDHKFLTAAGWVEAQYLSSLSVTQCKSSAATGRIISQKIWRALLAPITYRATDLSVPTNRERLLSAFGCAQANGTVPMLVVSGTGCITSAIVPLPCRPKLILSAGIAARLRLLGGLDCFAQTLASRRGVVRLALMMKNVNAPFARAISWLTNTASKKLARLNAVLCNRPVSGLVCLSVSEAGRADVYCLTVPETGNFALANGAIVANCADEARYACMSRPWVRKVEKLEVSKHIFEARPDGTVQSTLTIQQLIERQRKRARR